MALPAPHNVNVDARRLDEIFHRTVRRASHLDVIRLGGGRGRGRHSADGLEQLGLLRHHCDRSGSEGQRRLHGQASQAARLAVRGRRHPMVGAECTGARLPARRAAFHGRIRQADSCRQPLPVLRGRPRLPPAGRLRSWAWTAVRHPYYARHSRARRITTIRF